jgi:hypothetical protein
MYGERACSLRSVALRYDYVPALAMPRSSHVLRRPHARECKAPYGALSWIVAVSLSQGASAHLPFPVGRSRQYVKDPRCPNGTGRARQHGLA